VSFFDGARIVLYAVVDRHGRVVASQTHGASGNPQLGTPLANSAWLLALMTAVFLLAVTVVPLRRIRNLDALALAAFVANVAAVNAGLVALSVIVSVLLLAYLAFRCMSVGIRQDATAPTEVALFDWLTARWERSQRERTLRIVAAAALAAFLIITLTSVYESTVAAASLWGATDLLHGQLPYGHIGVLHGDTYPFLNYILYLPGAALTPVSDPFSSLSGALVVSAAAAMLTAAAIWRLARQALGADRLASTRAVLAWAAFPPVLLAASGGTDDLIVAACLAWTLVFIANSSRSLLLLAMAVWVKIVPLILAPLWLVRGERARARDVLPAALLSLLLCGYVVGLGGLGALGTMLSDISFPFHRGSLYAPWYMFSIGWLQPLVQAAVLAVLVWVMLSLRRSPSTWRDPRRLAGIFAALLLGVQLSANQWIYSYLPWVFPFIAVALLIDRIPSVASEVRGAASGETALDPPAGEPELQAA
jgi:hypothetical protein